MNSNSAYYERFLVDISIENVIVEEVSSWDHHTHTSIIVEPVTFRHSKLMQSVEHL